MDLDPNRTIYEAIPKYEGNSAIDHCPEALNTIVLPKWQNSFEYNWRDFSKSQVKFNLGLDELREELEIPD